MRKYALLLLLILTAVPLVAQTPRVELFGGYSYSNGNPEFSLDRLNLNGWNASVSLSLNRWLAAASDFAGHYGSPEIPVVAPCFVPPCPLVPVPFKANNHTFLFGPKFVLHRGKVTPFVNALFGVERLSFRQSINPASFAYPRAAFAMGFGGGMDYRIAPLLAWRTQADYLPTRQFSETQNNVRLSTGIVLRLGR